MCFVDGTPQNCIITQYAAPLQRSVYMFTISNEHSLVSSLMTMSVSSFIRLMVFLVLCTSGNSSIFLSNLLYVLLHCIQENSFRFLWVKLFSYFCVVSLCHVFVVLYTFPFWPFICDVTNINIIYDVSLLSVSNINL